MENKSTLQFSFRILRNLLADFFQNINIAWENSKAAITQVLVERGEKKQKTRKRNIIPHAVGF